MNYIEIADLLNKLGNTFLKDAFPNAEDVDDTWKTTIDIHKLAEALAGECASLFTRWYKYYKNVSRH